MISNFLRALNPQINASIGDTYMELSYLIAAQNVIRDENTKKFSYINIFSAIYLPQAGAVPIPQFFNIAGKVIGVPAGEADVVVKIVHEDGTELSQAVLKGSVEEGDLDINAYFGPVPITKEGKYFLRVVYNGVPLEDSNKYYFQGIKP